MRKLVLVHGRSQQNKDATALKREWLDALHAGFRAAGIDTRIDEADVAFPYYGDTLAQLADDVQVPAAEVIVAGPGDVGDGEREFIGAVVAEAVAKAGLSEADIRAAAEAGLIELGPLNWPWVLAALRALDRSPGLSGAGIALATRDVYTYLRNAGVQRVIDRGVVTAMAGGGDTVVVAHSLGTVVAYNPADTVALHPLDHAHFPVTPTVDNYLGVHNPTPNRHGISGYLGDPVVARRVHDALIG